MFTCIRTLFLSYKPRISNQSTKMQTSSAEISKHIKLHNRKPKIWPSFLISNFQIFCILVIADGELAGNPKVISKNVGYSKHGR